MKKKNTLLGVLMLVAVLALGIGYALTADNLVISGTATAQEAADFKVKFTETVTVADGDEAEVITAEKTGDLTATMSVKLAKVGDTATATFEVTNASEAGLNAVVGNVGAYVKGSTEAEFTSEYFEVTVEPTGTDKIAVNGTATVKVTVKLIKASVDGVTENFDVVLSDITAEQA